MREKYILIIYEDNGRNVLRDIIIYNTYREARYKIKEIQEKSNSNIKIYLYQVKSMSTYKGEKE